MTRARLLAAGPVASHPAAESLSPSRLPVDLARAVLTLLALLALAWQSLVVQTHVHAPGVAGGPAAVVSVVHQQPSARSSAPGDHQDTCPLCREQALSGGFTSPPWVTLAPPPRAYAAPATATIAAVAVRTASHAWRSRGPPHLRTF